MAPSTGKSSSPRAAPAVRTRWQKISRRLMLACGAAFALVIVVFFLIPVWMSNEQGRIYVLDRLNRSLNGPRVTIDQWSLGWFHGMHIRNLRIYQADGSLLLSCPNVSTGLTLWGLFRGDYDMGNTLAPELDMRIVKFSDGSTSLDSFVQQAGGVLGSMRGRSRTKGARVEIDSQKTGQSLTFAALKATITIAAPKAPFHVEIASAQETGPEVSLKATFPPTRTLADAAGRRQYWPLLTDLDFSAGDVPSAMLCDYLSLDPAWAQSLGESLSTVQLSARPAEQNSSTALTLLIRGPPGGRRIRRHLSMPAFSWPRRALPREPVLSIPSGDFHCSAAARLSKPLEALLGRLNPMLAESSANPGDRGEIVHVDVDALQLPLGAGAAARLSASGKLTFPPLLFTARDGPSIVRQLEVIGGDLPRTEPGMAPAGTPGTPARCMWNSPMGSSPTTIFWSPSAPGGSIFREPSGSMERSGCSPICRHPRRAFPRAAPKC